MSRNNVSKSFNWGFKDGVTGHINLYKYATDSEYKAGFDKGELKRVSPGLYDIKWYHKMRDDRKAEHELDKEHRRHEDKMKEIYKERLQAYKEAAKRSIKKEDIEAYKAQIKRLKSLTKEGCFIATVVYGDENAPEVQVLRDLRDNVLSENWLGRRVVEAYYSGAGKKLAAIISGKPKFAIRVIRKVLDYLVKRYGKDEGQPLTLDKL